MARWLTRVGLPRTQARILVLKVDLEFVLLRDARVLRVRFCVYVCLYVRIEHVHLSFSFSTYLLTYVCVYVSVCVYVFIL